MIALTLLQAMARGEVQALIARAADFYGPGASLSLLESILFSRLRAGKSPQWVGNPEAAHTFTFTPDIARALLQLSDSHAAFGRTWHLPTARGLENETVTGKSCAVVSKVLSPMHIALIKFRVGEHLVTDRVFHQERFQPIADPTAILRPLNQPLIEDDTNTLYVDDGSGLFNSVDLAAGKVNSLPDLQDYSELMLMNTLPADPEHMLFQTTRINSRRGVKKMVRPRPNVEKDDRPEMNDR